MKEFIFGPMLPTKKIFLIRAITLGLISLMINAPFIIILKGNEYLPNDIFLIAGLIVNLSLYLLSVRLYFGRYRKIFPNAGSIGELYFLALMFLPIFSIPFILPLLFFNDKVSKRKDHLSYLLKGTVAGIILVILTFIFQFNNGLTLFENLNPSDVSADKQAFIEGTLLFGQLGGIGRYFLSIRADMNKWQIIKSESLKSSLHELESVVVIKHRWTNLGLKKVIADYSHAEMAKKPPLSLFTDEENEITKIKQRTTEDIKKFQKQKVGLIKDSWVYIPYGSSLVLGMPGPYLALLLDR